MTAIEQTQREGSRWAAPLASRYLHDRRRGLTWWVVGLALYCCLMASFFPTVRDSEAFSVALDEYPDAVKDLLGGQAAFDLSSGSGFLQVEVFSLMVPVLLSIVAIGVGGSVARDEERGFLDLILANSISRARYLVERSFAMASMMVLLGSVVASVLFVAGTIVSFDVGLAPLALAVFGSCLLAMLAGSVALTAGAFTGRRSRAIGAGSGFLILSYLANAAGELVDGLAFLRSLSPYHWLVTRSALFDDVSVVGLVAGLVLVLLLVAMSVSVFERRDLH